MVLKPFGRAPGSGWWSRSLGGLLLWLGCRAIIRRRIHQHLSRARTGAHRGAGAPAGSPAIFTMTIGARTDSHLPDERSGGRTSPRRALRRAKSSSASPAWRRELVAALYQTVWTVNPEHDHLEALVNYIMPARHKISAIPPGSAAAFIPVKCPASVPSPAKCGTTSPWP